MLHVGLFWMGIDSARSRKEAMKRVEVSWLGLRANEVRSDQCYDSLHTVVFWAGHSGEVLRQM